MIGFLHIPRGDEYGSRLFLASTNSLDAFDAFSLVTRTWDDSDNEYDPPKGFEFAGDSENIIMTSSKCGRTVLLKLRLRDGERPHEIFKDGSSSAYYPLRDNSWDEILVSGSSFIDSSVWHIVDVSGVTPTQLVSSATKGGTKFGLSQKMVTEIWYEGADDVCVHSFIIRPSNFDENKKYPWVLMPHGGPVSSWDDAWSTRVSHTFCCCVVYRRTPANQNKVEYGCLGRAGLYHCVSQYHWQCGLRARICKKFVKSTTFSTEQLVLIFSNLEIKGEWGGRPFQDLLNLMSYLETLPYLDQKKAVLAGASYGGYMVSWMLGHEIINRVRLTSHSIQCYTG